jgi:tripartite-type tricarboxylate transporter receptor subunit TctC
LWRALLPLLLGAGAACAQTWPQKPVRVVAPQAGTSIDFLLRSTAPAVAENLGQPLVIENRALIGVEVVARAPADGYTLICYTNPMWLMPLFQQTSWDPVRDFAPITLMASTPSLLVVNPALPVKSVKELIALARAKPKELNYASGSTGAATHIGAELFKAMAGVDMVRINYKGTAAAITDLMSGQVQVMFPSAGAATQFIKDGRLRALAVASPESSALTPGLPTVAASAGLPGYESRTLTAIFAPARTPQAVITRLNEQFVRALNRPDIKEKLFSNAIEVVGSTPQELAATVSTEMAMVGKVVKERGLRD